MLLLSSFKLPHKGLRPGKGGDLTTKLHMKNRTSIIRKIVLRITEPALLSNRC